MAAAPRRPRSRAVRPERPGAPARRAGHDPQHRPMDPPRSHARRAGTAPGSAAWHLARRGDQHPPGAPELPRHVREPAVRGPAPAAPPRGALADREGLRRRRDGGPAPLDHRRHARDPRALPARARALRPPHGPRGGDLRSRLAAADLVLAGSADVRVRGAVRAARAVDAAAGDPQPEHGQLGGLHPRDRRAAVVALLRAAADRRAAGDLGRHPDPPAAHRRAEPGDGARLRLLPGGAGDPAGAR